MRLWVNLYALSAQTFRHSETQAASVRWTSKGSSVYKYAARASEHALLEFRDSSGDIVTKSVGKMTQFSDCTGCSLYIGFISLGSKTEFRLSKILSSLHQHSFASSGYFFNRAEDSERSRSIFSESSARLKKYSKLAKLR